MAARESRSPRRYELGLLLLAVVVLAIALTGIKVPLLTNLRVSLVVFLVLGMGVCTAGIGRVAATGAWTHPLAIAGYTLGALILVVGIAGVAGVTLPLIADARQALIAVAILSGAKVLTALAHSLLARGRQRGQMRSPRARRLLPWLLIPIMIGLCVLTGFGAVWVARYQALGDDEPEVTLVPDVADVTYCTVDTIALKMDLYFPETPSPWQVLVYVHGGSFTSGDKRSGSGTADIPAMVERGYAVAAVNYRLMPDAPFPAQVQDAKCAIRYLRAQAEAYNLSTERIGIWGGSAGGHLAAMVGLTNENPEYDVGEYLTQSSHIDAVVEMFGPTDLTTEYGWLQRWLLRRAFGTDDPEAAILWQASPLTYVTAAAPPFLIMHGEDDSAVPVAQAHALHERLREAGTDVSLVIIENANHNFKPTGGPISPTRAQISEQMADFYDDRLLAASNTLNDR